MGWHWHKSKTQAEPESRPLGTWDALPSAEGLLSGSCWPPSFFPLFVQQILTEQPLLCARCLTRPWESRMSKSDALPAPWNRVRLSENRQVNRPKDNIITK